MCSVLVEYCLSCNKDVVRRTEHHNNCGGQFVQTIKASTDKNGAKRRAVRVKSRQTPFIFVFSALGLTHS